MSYAYVVLLYRLLYLNLKQLLVMPFHATTGFWCNNASFGAGRGGGGEEVGPLLLFNPLWLIVHRSWPAEYKQLRLLPKGF
jgi:hypothetical protein